MTSAGNDTTATSPALIQARWMLLSRRTEERLRSLYRQGRVPGGVYLGIGQEALSAACGMSLRRGDVFAPLIRDSAGRLAFGEPLLEVFRTCLGKATGRMRGRDGNIHRGEVESGLMPMISHLGAMVPVTLGILLARRLRGTDGTVGLASIGDGAMACGATHEGLNAAAVHRLPLVAVVANNRFSYSTPNAESFACGDLVERAVGYGMTGHSCDGTDPAACLTTVEAAVGAARAGEGPQLVVASLLRRSGHGEHDDATYVPRELLATSPDPLDLAREQVGADEATWTAWTAEADAAIDEALAAVEAEPDADPSTEDWRCFAAPWPGLEPV